MVNVDVSIHTAWSLQSSSVIAENEGYMKVSGSKVQWLATAQRANRNCCEL